MPCLGMVHISPAEHDEHPGLTKSWRDLDPGVRFMSWRGGHRARTLVITQDVVNHYWRGVRVAEGAAFEMRSAGDRRGGSNPSLSVLPSESAFRDRECGFLFRYPNVPMSPVLCCVELRHRLLSPRPHPYRRRGAAGGCSRAVRCGRHGRCNDLM